MSGFALSRIPWGKNRVWGEGLRVSIRQIIAGRTPKTVRCQISFNANALSVEMNDVALYSGLTISIVSAQRPPGCVSIYVDQSIVRAITAARVTTARTSTA